MGAPMCTLKPTIPSPSAPVVYANNIPPANKDNLVDVVNALRNLVLGGQSTGGSGGGGQSGNTGGGFTSNEQNQFQVVEQIVTPIKVYDPNDPSGQTYVTVNQITGLRMQNPYDKSTWSWTAPGSTPGDGS